MSEDLAKEQEMYAEVIKLAQYVSDSRHEQHGAFFKNDIKQHASGLLNKLWRCMKDVGYVLSGTPSKVNPDNLIDNINYCVMVLASTEAHKKHPLWEEARKKK